jgi:hypothetical protein
VPAIAYDHGSDHVQLIRARFRKFHDGKCDQQVFDPIGRAWAVGLLENDRVDPAALRDAGRNYAAAYWGYYPSVAGVAGYGGKDRAGSGGDRHSEIRPDPRGVRFETLDGQLGDTGRRSYAAAQSLCLDHYWFPDNNPAWLDRLINDRLVAARVPVGGELSRCGDAEYMAAALDGLLALAEGLVRRRAA